MEFAPFIVLYLILLTALYGAIDMMKRAFKESRIITRLKESGVIQQGTITKISLKNDAPFLKGYGQVFFTYKENHTSCRGRHTMSQVAAQTLKREKGNVAVRCLPGQPFSARIDSSLTDSSLVKRHLLVGCALLGISLPPLAGSAAIFFVLGWKPLEIGLIGAGLFALVLAVEMMLALLLGAFNSR